MSFDPHLAEGYYRPRMSEALELESALGHFLAVVEHGSFTAAAKAQHVSQPSLSVAVRKLEERLGTPLLHRHARGVEPTRAGRILVERSRQARGALEAAGDEIAALLSEPRGRYRLGCHESLGAYFLPGFMGPFLERYPGIELNLFNANSVQVEEAIVAREIDLGLVVNPGRHPDTVVQPLFDDQVLFVAARRRVRSFESDEDALQELPLLHVPAIRQTQHLLGTLRQRDLAPRREIACSSMALVKSLVLDGTGVGVLPWRVAVHGVAKGRLRALDLPRYDDHIALVWRADAPSTAALEELRRGIRAHGERLAEEPVGET